MYSHCLEIENMEDVSHGIHFTDRFCGHASKNAVSPRKAHSMGHVFELLISTW